MDEVQKTYNKKYTIEQASLLIEYMQPKRAEVMRKVYRQIMGNASLSSPLPFLREFKEAEKEVLADYNSQWIEQDSKKLIEAQPDPDVQDLVADLMGNIRKAFRGEIPFGGQELKTVLEKGDKLVEGKKFDTKPEIDDLF